MQVPTTQEEWLKTSDQFRDRWNFNNCCGAVDGKHVVITPPANSGSEYYNYKHTYSIVLMALVDADYKFLFVDVGSNGRVSDGGVFGQSALSHALETNSLNLPAETALPGRVKPQPFVIVGDEAFPLRHNLMKPFSGKSITRYEQRIFNYRLSRARRIVENAFGILANRFRVFLSRIPLSPEKVQLVVLAACALHNFLRTQECEQNSDGWLDTEDITTGELTQGSWRQTGTNGSWHPLSTSTSRRSSDYAAEVRNEFCEYFSSEGKVQWQDYSVRDY